MSSVFNKWCSNNLVWLPEKGMGYLNADPIEYDQNYFDEYCRRSETDIGRKLNDARVALVNKYYDGELIDVGIGSGMFVEARESTYGYDINQSAIDWLNQRNLLAYPLTSSIPARSFWDALEHIESPEEYLNCEWVFVSIPVFEDGKVTTSKHYKPGEHLWYWTSEGFKNWMNEQGFDLIEQNSIESDLGRKDIETFVFKRK